MAIFFYVLCFIVSGNIYASQPQSGKVQAESEAELKKIALRKQVQVLLALNAQDQQAFHHAESLKRKAEEKAEKIKREKNEIENELDNILANNENDFVKKAKSKLKQQRKLYVQDQLALKQNKLKGNAKKALEKSIAERLTVLKALDIAVKAKEQEDSDLSDF